MRDARVPAMAALLLAAIAAGMPQPARAASQASIAPADAADRQVPRESCRDVPARACLVEVAALIAARMSQPAWRGYSLAACAAATRGAGEAGRYLQGAEEAGRLAGGGADAHAALASMRAKLGDFTAARASAAALAEPGRRALAFAAIAAAALERSATAEGVGAVRAAIGPAMAVADPWYRALALSALVDPSMRLGAPGIALEAGRLAAAAAREVDDGWMRALATARAAEALATLGDAPGAMALALAVPDRAARERALSRIAVALAAAVPEDARRAADGVAEPLARAEALAALAAAAAGRSREAAASLLSEARGLVAGVAGADRYDFAAALQRIAAAEIALGEHAAAAATLGVALGAIDAVPEEYWRAQALGDILAMAAMLP